MHWFFALLHNLGFVGGAWLFVVFAVETLGPILWMRYHFQKMSFQVALSAEWGGLLQVAYYMVAIGVIHRTPAFASLMYVPLLLFAAVVGVLVGIVWASLDSGAEWADLCHHLWVIPQQVFLFVVFLFVIFGYGNMAEKVSSFVFLGLAYVLFEVDKKLGTLAQTVWIWRRTGLWLGDRQKNPPKS